MSTVEPPQKPDLPDEAPLGGTPAGRAANTALRAFSKAARAFSLYDAQNEAVRRFLQDYRDALAAFLSAHGALDLEVRPFELALRGEIVHAEKDREKSLASRLFRDGIRRLTIQPGVTWEEELKLLEVVSVRFIGVRQQEEDVVTLLTRAAFRFITFASVAGLVASGPDEAEAPKRQGEARTYPPAFDGPLPPVVAARQFGYFEIPASALAGFEEEEAPSALPGNAVRMVRELLDDATEGELKTLVPAVEEVRDYLLADLDVKHLRDLARVVAGQQGRFSGIFGPALRPLAAPYTLQKLLATVPQGAEPSESLVELLDQLGDYGANLLDPLLDRIGAELAAGATKVDPALDTLALRAARTRKDRLVARLPLSPPPLAEVVLRYLRAVDPASAGAETAKALLDNPDPGAKLTAVKLLAETGGGEDALLQLLASDAEEVRIAAAASLAKQGGKKSFQAIADQTAAREPAGLSEAEAEAMGTALAQLSAEEARPLFESWTRPPQPSGLLARLVGKKARRMLVWAAASGYAHIPGEETLTTLRELQAQAQAQNDEELKRRCLKSIAFWRRGATPRG